MGAVQVTVSVAEVLWQIPDDQIVAEARDRGALIQSGAQSLSDDDRLELERHLYPKWRSVEECRLAYNKHMSEQNESR